MTGGIDVHPIGVRRDQIIEPDMGEIEMEGQAVEKRVRRILLRLNAFIKGNDAKARGCDETQPIALNGDFASIHGGGDMGRGAGRHALRHGSDDHAAVCLCKQSTFGNRSPGVQGGGQIETAQQAALGDVDRKPFQRARRAQVLGEILKPGIADRTRARPHRHAPKAECINGQKGSRQKRVIPNRGHAVIAHQPKCSSSARSTRTVEPESSSGSRRKRWRKADGATRFK